MTLESVTSFSQARGQAEPAGLTSMSALSQPTALSAQPSPFASRIAPNNDFRPAISRNGLELFFDSSRPGLGPSPGRDLWVSTRRSLGEPWSTPVNLGSPVNTAEFDEALPALSSNGRELFFSSSNRPGGVGGSDLYLSTRTRPKKAEKRRLK